MAKKGPWESRVGMLLKEPLRFAWAFKPPDTKFYGGQARIDWLACDWLGYFWMVEVKQVKSESRSVNLMVDVSAGQRDALDAVASSSFGRAILAVGQDKTLHIYEWRRVRWAWSRRRNNPRILKPELQPLSEAPITAIWTGESSWRQLDPVAALARLDGVGDDEDIPPIRILPGGLWQERDSSPSISKRRGSIPTPTLRLVEPSPGPVRLVPSS